MHSDTLVKCENNRLSTDKIEGTVQSKLKLQPYYLLSSRKFASTEFPSRQIKLAF